MKMKVILVSALATLMLFACSKEETESNQTNGETADVAYLSLKVKSESTRASGQENASSVENTLSSLYLFTFDANGNVIGIPGTSSYFIQLSGSDAITEPSAFRVSALAKNMLLIANPGTKLQGVINNVGGGTNFSTMNAAIEGVNLSEINGFTMINSGEESGLNAGDRITTPFIAIDEASIKKVADYAAEADPEAAAKQAAEDARMDVKVERLASKLQLKVKPDAEMVVKPSTAKFTFGNWTIDGINTAFYPYAEKTLLDVKHNGSSYLYNFYTQDPNFNGAVGDGIAYTTIDQQTYDPVLVAPYTWMGENDTNYAIENTMAAAEQKYGNATRLVIKGTYYPEAAWSGDWFNFAGINYETLKKLQDAYAVVGATNLQAACDKMYTKIRDYATANSISLTGANFATLTEADLAKINNGGEVIKDGKEDVIRWYQNGLNYYYYEIRHDNENETEMAFGKYGIVRNNWYSLTLGTVNGAGTPWYPDIDNPGPGDPDPVDPIDESAGYLGIEVELAPWIIWNTDIVI